ncbi:radical SAM protein [Candidatus Pacearchaeota archaeon]|nr:radical SAM protein [Candidatus Pacearchaeota archaeon]
MGKISKKSSVTFVELPPTQFGILNGEPGYDIYSHIKIPARAIHVLEGVLKADGWENVESINPLFHGEGRKLSKENFNRIFSSDILGISAITRTSPQSVELAKMHKANNPKGIIIFGGSDSKFRAAEYLEGGADIVVMGEGEKTIRSVMERLENGADLGDVDGIAFKANGKLTIAKPAELMSPDELSRLPHPYYDKKVRVGVHTAVVETSRGCPHNCNFCSVTMNYGSRYRTKSVEYSAEEFKRTKDMGRLYFISDDNFAGNRKHTKELLEQLIERGITRSKKNLHVQITAKAAKDSELLGLMKRAGVSTVYIGFESIVDASLNDMSKASNATENKAAARIFRDFGFWVHGMLVPGTDSDTPETLKETLSWAKKSLDSVQFFPLTPLPGTPLMHKMKEEKRILTDDLSLYDAQHVVIIPKNFTPYKLQRQVYDMYEEFYSVKESARRLFRAPQKQNAFKIIAYALSKGIKSILYNKQSLQHLEFLKSVS